MYKQTGAQIIIRLLENQGIRIIPGIPGGMNLPIYDVLSESKQIRHVLARHEQAAGFMAQGMARVTGQPAVCLATSGPGATNILTAIADAKLDSIPIICITGQVPGSMLGTDAFQEVDTYGMSLPITKHNFMVRHASELLEVIPAAFRIAASGRPGPVLIDVPKDVQKQEVEFEQWPEPGMVDPHPIPDASAIRRAADLINQAKRPVLYLGGGVLQANADKLVRQLADKADIVCAMSLMGLGAIEDGHPLSLGLVGMHGFRFANLALEECDLLVACGSRFGDRTTGRVAGFCPQAGIIHLDIDESEINKIKPAAVSVVGHLQETLAQLLPLISEQARPEWRDEINSLRSKHQHSPEKDSQAPGRLIRLAGELLGPGAIITTDVGQHQMWTAQYYPHRTPRHWLTSGGLGTMGFGLPAAMGAALAGPDKVVACFSGDGSLLMNIQELATLVEENLNVKVMVFDNQALGLVHQQQDLFFGKRHFASRFSHAVDFPQVARGFGLRSLSLDREQDAEVILRREFEQPGPCLIRVPVAVAAKVFPMVPPGAANKDMIGGESHVSR